MTYTYSMNVFGVSLDVEIKTSVVVPDYVDEMSVYAKDSKIELTPLISEETLNEIETRARELMKEVA